MAVIDKIRLKMFSTMHVCVSQFHSSPESQYLFLALEKSCCPIESSPDRQIDIGAVETIAPPAFDGLNFMLLND